MVGLLGRFGLRPSPSLRWDRLFPARERLRHARKWSRLSAAAPVRSGKQFFDGVDRITWLKSQCAAPRKRSILRPLQSGARRRSSEIIALELSVITLFHGLVRRFLMGCRVGGRMMPGRDQHAVVLAAVNRDRGEPRGSSPPTPPYIRVRIRRFGGLSVHGLLMSGRPRRRKRALVKARCRASQKLSRQGPFGLKMASLASRSETLRRRSSR